LPKLVTFLINI